MVISIIFYLKIILFIIPFLKRKEDDHFSVVYSQSESKNEPHSINYLGKIKYEI